MSSSPVLTSLRHLRSLLAAQQGQEQSDEQLLTLFAERREESAFSVLMRRHGPMVLGVCRRVLGHEQDAEDAFQATFLVLAQRAAALRNKNALASFLHGTAFHLASKAKRAAGRRRKYEDKAPARSSVDLTQNMLWREVRGLLDEEIGRLPEKYRSVFVLCCLEELSQAEAALRLGLKQGTVASRLTHARKLLARRLTRRGVELTVVLAASGLAAQTATALPVALMTTTIKAALATAAGKELTGIVSASVVELIRNATTAMLLSKAKWATAMFLAATLLAGAGAWTCFTLATSQSTEPQAEPPATPSRPAQEQKAETPRKEPKDGITVTGRVLDPDGKPVKGARLYWPRLPKTAKSEEDIEFPQRAKTDVDGRFRFELPRADILAERKFPLLAAADGYGVDWAELPKADTAAELILRLVKDQPIEGRIISTEGKPLAGITVQIFGASKPRDRLDNFLELWKKDWQKTFSQQSSPPQAMLLPPAEKTTRAVTDADGRFRLRGAGAERLVMLRLRGPRTSQTMLWVVNRADFDPAPVNKVVLDRTPSEDRRLGQPLLLYGPRIEYVAPAGRRIEGTVRQAGTGKAVPGFAVFCGTGYNDGGVRAVADKNGRYKLDNLPKKDQYIILAEPPANSSWLRAGARAQDKAGLQPITVDFTVARGIVVSGRIIDRTTGKGVRGGIRFVPLPGNKFAGKPGYDSYKYDRTVRTTEADGRFKLTVLPGPGVLMVQAISTEKANGGQELSPYKQAEFDAKDRERVALTDNGEERFFTAINNSIEFLNNQNVVKYLDLAPDAGTTELNLFVERGATQTVRVEDPDGKPLTGTTVAGVTAKWPVVYPIRYATCTIFALDTKKPRRVFFFHTQRNLAGSLTLRGDEKGPLTVRLALVGTVMGRLLERDGQPIVGVFVQLNPPDGTARELYRHLQQSRPPVRADKDGRFRIEGIVPDVKFVLNMQQGRTFFVGEPRIGARQVKPGETLDLGAIYVKPGQ